MKISPVANLGGGGVSGQPAAPVARSLKMTTNASPLTADDPRQAEPSIPDATETSAAEGDTQPLSPKFAELARQRRALQVKERELQERVKAFEAQSSTQADVIRKGDLLKDPIGVILAQGLTYDDLTKAIVARDDNGQNIQAMVDSRLKSAEETFEKKLSDRDEMAEQQALSEMQRHAQAMIAEGEDFALVRETRSLPKVMDLIKRTYKSSGEVLDVSEALKLVEGELFKDQERLLRLQKVRAHMSPEPQQPKQPDRQQQMRTLTNRDTSQVPLTAKQRALAAFNGTLRR